MKNKIIFSLFIIFVICGIYAGRKNDSRLSGIPEFSDEYLVGFSYGGNGGFGSMPDVQSAKVIICTNHEVLVLLPNLDTYWSAWKHDEPVAVFTLTDETTVFEFSEEGLLSEYETQEEFHMVKGLFDEPSNENVYYSLYTLVFNG